jgi:CheY-like chemotaxis protein
LRVEDRFGYPTNLGLQCPVTADPRRAPVQPSKILVVDDSKLIHKMFDMMLRQYQLVHALDGREALTLLAEHADVDLILLDVNMPNMNGLEFLDQIKGDSAFADIPVVMISTEGTEEDTQRGLEAGAVAYITKPFSSTELREVIDRLPSER